MFEPDKNLAVISPHFLAAYISRKIGRKMSHLKLQKLLYYVESFHLAYFGQTLINDDFEAWVHGPVNRSVYNSLSDKSKLYTEIIYHVEEGDSDPIKELPKIVTEEQLEIIDSVLAVYGKKSGVELESLTHEEKPWLEARIGYDPSEKCNELINKESQKKYYRNFLN